MTVSSKWLFIVVATSSIQDVHSNESTHYSYLVLDLIVIHEMLHISYRSGAIREDSRSTGGNRQLNYAKIKADLASSSIHYRTRGLLLQALRWVNHLNSDDKIDKYVFRIVLLY